MSPWRQFLPSMAEIEAISRNDQWSLAKPCNRGIHTARAKGVNLRDQQQTHEQSGESRSEEGHGGEGVGASF